MQEMSMKYKLILSFTMLNILAILSFAHAYIDPNTGGFFFQTVAPFVYGLLGVIVVFWKRITGYVKGLFGKKKKENTSGDS